MEMWSLQPSHPQSRPQRCLTKSRPQLCPTTSTITHKLCTTHHIHLFERCAAHTRVTPHPPFKLLSLRLAARLTQASLFAEATQPAPRHKRAITHPQHTSLPLHADRALPLYERALQIYEQHFGPDHPEVAHTLTDLAVLHLEQVGWLASHLGTGDGVAGIAPGVIGAGPRSETCTCPCFAPTAACRVRAEARAAPVIGCKHPGLDHRRRALPAFIHACPCPLTCRLCRGARRGLHSFMHALGPRPRKQAHTRALLCTHVHACPLALICRPCRGARRGLHSFMRALDPHPHKQAHMRALLCTHVHACLCALTCRPCRGTMQWGVRCLSAPWSFKRRPWALTTQTSLPSRTC